MSMLPWGIPTPPNALSCITPELRQRPSPQQNGYGDAHSHGGGGGGDGGDGGGDGGEKGGGGDGGGGTATPPPPAILARGQDQ